MVLNAVLPNRRQSSRIYYLIAAAAFVLVSISVFATVAGSTAFRERPPDLDASGSAMKQVLTLR